MKIFWGSSSEKLEIFLKKVSHEKHEGLLKKHQGLFKKLLDVLPKMP